MSQQSSDVLAITAGCRHISAAFRCLLRQLSAGCRQLFLQQQAVKDGKQGMQKTLRSTTRPLAQEKVIGCCVKVGFSLSDSCFELTLLDMTHAVWRRRRTSQTNRVR